MIKQWSDEATLQTRELPFTVTGIDSQKQSRKAFGEAFKAAQEQSLLNGTDKITLEEINAVIADCRQEMSSEK